MTEDLGCHRFHTKKQRSDLHCLGLNLWKSLLSKEHLPGTQNCQHTKHSRKIPVLFKYNYSDLNLRLRGAALLLWACSETTCQVGLVKSCARYQSVRQGWKALALGRCWFNFCLNPTPLALISTITSLPPLVGKAGRTFLHSTCHGKDCSKTPATAK